MKGKASGDYLAGLMGWPCRIIRAEECKFGESLEKGPLVVLVALDANAEHKFADLGLRTLPRVPRNGHQFGEVECRETMPEKP